MWVDVHPMLQRILISLAAGTAATSAVVSTAKRPHKPKKRRKKRPDGSEAPVSLGATALHDVKLPDERGLTPAEWRHGMAQWGGAVATRITSVFKRAPSEGGTSTPNSVQTPEGTRAPNAHKRRRDGKKRPQATLWDSAKESLKQTVKETVRDEVKSSPVGSALDTLKDVTEKVKEGAANAAASAARAVNQAIDKPPSSPNAETPAAKPEETTDVGVNLKNSVDAVGSWLQGPGTPGYQKRERPAAGGDVVDAKDPDEEPPPS